MAVASPSRRKQFPRTEGMAASMRSQLPQYPQLSLRTATQRSPPPRQPLCQRQAVQRALLQRMTRLHSPTARPLSVTACTAQMRNSGFRTLRLQIRTQHRTLVMTSSHRQRMAHPRLPGSRRDCSCPLSSRRIRKSRALSSSSSSSSRAPCSTAMTCSPARQCCTWATRWSSPSCLIVQAPSREPSGCDRELATPKS